ncbi:hypothetical protein [Algoriphagus persicinus]|uniref:hypothetical protein n=1 Tax=Algoriphagus persicinus TaxID=3108754 RepID=UPI002B3DBB04|nr:hypothetical protein [Algoriphagus sp. E1-3-M2]MEB2783263.1 hypothetical protein [Algoriphagus sp. E1-3-M2]
MGNQDIRWKQRFANYERAFRKLEQAVIRMKADYFENGKIDESKFKAGDDILKEGLIQRFEYYPAFLAFKKSMEIKRGESQPDMFND